MTTYLNRRGMVFVDGRPMKQVQLYYQLGLNDNTYWVEANGQKVHIRLSGDDDPSNHKIELTSVNSALHLKFLSYLTLR